MAAHLTPAAFVITQTNGPTGSIRVKGGRIQFTVRLLLKMILKMSSYQWDLFKKASTGMNIDAHSLLTFLTLINMKHSVRWGGDVEAGTAAAGEWH